MLSGKTGIYAPTGGADGSNPKGGVIVDSSGALYGTTADGGLAGKVFKLMPPSAGKTQWTYTVLHSFGSGNDGNTPTAGLRTALLPRKPLWAQRRLRPKRDSPCRLERRPAWMAKPYALDVRKRIEHVLKKVARLFRFRHAPTL
jgi:hypothetical protein